MTGDPCVVQSSSESEGMKMKYVREPIKHKATKSGRLCLRRFSVQVRSPAEPVRRETNQMLRRLWRARLAVGDCVPGDGNFVVLVD